MSAPVTYALVNVYKETNSRIILGQYQALQIQKESSFVYITKMRITVQEISKDDSMWVTQHTPTNSRKGGNLVVKSNFFF